MAKVQNFTIPFPDFKMGETIESEQFDENNATIVDKLNEVISTLNDEKTDRMGDHAGTWRGYTPGEVGEAINGGRLDVLEPLVTILQGNVNQMKDAQRDLTGVLNELKDVSKHNQLEIANHNLFIDASNRVANGYTYGTNITTAFNMDIDFARTNATSNLSVGQTVIPVVSANGFSVGKEVTIYDDVDYERVTITAISGTNITVTALTKSFKFNAMIARTMFTKDNYAKALSYGEFVQNGTKRALYYAHGKTAEAFTQAPNTSFGYGDDKAIANLKQISFDVDVLIPSDEGVTQQYQEKTIFSVPLSSAPPYSGLRVGHTYGGYTHESQPTLIGKNNIGNEWYADCQNTLYFVFMQSNGFKVVLTAPNNFLKSYYGKHINIKVKADLNSLSTVASNLKFYVNDKLIQMTAKANSIPANSSFYLNNSLLLFSSNYFTNEDRNTSYYNVGYSKIARFVMYRDINYNVKQVEYLFESDPVNNQYNDTSGNSFNLNVASYQNYPTPTPVAVIENIPKRSYPTVVSDLRFTTTQKSKEIGTWVSRSADLIPSGGKYGNVDLTLTTKGTEDQYVASRDTVGDTEVRLTYTKSATSMFPSITKVIGGVY